MAVDRLVPKPSLILFELRLKQSAGGDHMGAPNWVPIQVGNGMIYEWAF